MSLAWSMPSTVRLAWALGLAVASAPSPAVEAPSWRVEQGDLRVVVPLKPGGAFEARTASLKGVLALGPVGLKPAILVGELVVDLATIDTGIGLRNQHLRERYLQVARGPGYDKARLSEIRLDAGADASYEGRSAFTGKLVLHDVQHQVAGTAVIQQQAAGVRVEALFPVTLTDFGIEPPEYLGVGVANKVMVKVVFAARLQAAAGR